MYPLTVTLTRYQGVYEGGKWAAFNAKPYDIPYEAFGDDVTAQYWWSGPTLIVGLGETPQDAIDDLESKLANG